MTIENCPKCDSEHVHEKEECLKCTDCFYEWKMTTQNNEEKWKKEFEKIAIPYSLNQSKLESMEACYLAARKKGQEEIDELQESCTEFHLQANINKSKVLHQEATISQLKKQLEDLKAPAKLKVDGYCSDCHYECKCQECGCSKQDLKDQLQHLKALFERVIPLVNEAVEMGVVRSNRLGLWVDWLESARKIL